MSAIEQLLQQNAAYRHDPALRMMPKLRTLIVGCVDLRVNPEALFGLSTGDVAVLRNVGGRVTPDILAALDLLRTVAEGNGAPAGLNLVLLHHTDCGVQHLAGRRDAFASYLGSDELHLTDPRASIRADLARLPQHVTATGLVYDVKTGRVEAVT